MKNSASPAQIEHLTGILTAGAFGHQKGWFEASQHRDRRITSARYIGATSYFAREAVLDALTTGRNQVIISPSSALAAKAADYAATFAKEAEITPIFRNNRAMFGNGASVLFFDNNSLYGGCAGNVYLADFAFFGNPWTAYLSARAISMHKQHRMTLFSCPSEDYRAYHVWRNSRADKIPALRLPAAGKVCSDGIWRQSVTLEQAIKQGCSLHPANIIDQLKQKMPTESYAMEFDCSWARAIKKKEDANEKA